jgi:hypothetical protein
MKAMSTAETMINTEIMVEETGRKLYKRRLALLGMHMANLGSMYQTFEKALSSLEDMKMSTLSKTSKLLKEGARHRNEKFFLDKKDD